MLYPLKFKNIYKEKIWGGSKLKSVLNKKDIFYDNIGESWEISGLENNVSEISNGFLKGKSLIEIIDSYKEKIIGGKVFAEFGNNFPLLIKFIDANDDLSVQVHPNDLIAKKLHNANGKTELWYIIDVDNDSNLISGLNKSVKKEVFSEAISENKVTELLNFVPVSKGDSFFIPAGKIHAICKGILLAEIQQTSDITYRIYDWNRPGSDGKMRELHIENSLLVADLEYKSDSLISQKKIDNNRSEIKKCNFFTVNILKTDAEINIDYSNIDSFIIYMCVEGEFIIKNDNFEINVIKGETILIPAEIKNFGIFPIKNSEILEIYI
jgi:mannose-6-phosphate isomerase